MHNCSLLLGMFVHSAKPHNNVIIAHPMHVLSVHVCHRCVESLVTTLRSRDVHYHHISLQERLVPEGHELHDPTVHKYLLASFNRPRTPDAAVTPPRPSFALRALRGLSGSGPAPMKALNSPAHAGRRAPPKLHQERVCGGG